jgi:hypothetical protein
MHVSEALSSATENDCIKTSVCTSSINVCVLRASTFHHTSFLNPTRLSTRMLRSRSEGQSRDVCGAVVVAVHDALSVGVVFWVKDDVTHLQ